MENITMNGHIWFQTASGLRIGEGRAKLLEEIENSGSISEAARKLEIPYRRAWGMIKDMNTNAKESLVIKEVGGKDGGRSILTEEGKRIVALFKKINKCFKEFSEDESSRISGGEK